MAGRHGWLVVGLALAAACAPSDSEPEPKPKPTSELVGSWSQAGVDREWVEEAMPIPAQVLATDAERESWLAERPGDAAEGDSFDALRAVDLAENFIVIGGYHRCTEYSLVTVSDDGEVAFEVHDDDERTDCAWSPYTIDAWAIPLELTGGEAPEEIGDDAARR